jgi:hypothetical protein
MAAGTGDSKIESGRVQANSTFQGEGSVASQKLWSHLPLLIHSRAQFIPQASPTPRSCCSVLEVFGRSPNVAKSRQSIAEPIQTHANDRYR